MRISSFFYTIGQGFRNLGRNRWYTLASAATIAACLFLFGVFYSIVTNFQHIVLTADDPKATNTEDCPDRVVPTEDGNAAVADGSLCAVLPKMSWNVIRLVK